MGVSGQRQASAALYPGERAPGTHCTGGWVGPRAGLDTEAKGNVLCPFRESNLDRPVVQFVARHLRTKHPWLQADTYCLHVQAYGWQRHVPN
jgi:hypothetical protein